MPLGDLFVASISATIRWAIACGVPVINYDTYRYRYDDYKGVSGVVLVENAREFNAVIQRFVDDSDFANDLKRRQDMHKMFWGIIDAGFADRFAAIVSGLIGGTAVLTPRPTDDNLAPRIPEVLPDYCEQAPIGSRATLPTA